jgi:hypothetical protein
MLSPACGIERSLQRMSMTLCTNSMWAGSSKNACFMSSLNQGPAWAQANGCQMSLPGSGESVALLPQFMPHWTTFEPSNLSEAPELPFRSTVSFLAVSRRSWNVQSFFG